MNWRQIERWATIALYAAAGVALAVLLVSELAPAASPTERLAHNVAVYLTAMGDIGGGTLFVIVLVSISVMGGIWIMVLIAKGVDTLTAIIRDMRSRDERAKEAGRQAGRKEGREEGREEILAVLRERLAELGISLNDLFPPETDGLAAEQSEREVRAEGADSKEEEERIRAIVREYLQEMGINPEETPPTNRM